MTTPTYATEVKLFNKWSYDDIEVGDISLEVCNVFPNAFHMHTNSAFACGHDVGSKHVCVDDVSGFVSVRVEF